MNVLVFLGPGSYPYFTWLSFNWSTRISLVLLSIRQWKPPAWIMHQVLCLFFSNMHNLEVVKQNICLFGKFKNYIEWKAMSSLWNIQIFKYTPDYNCRPALGSTDRYCNVTRLPHWFILWPHEYCKNISALK